MDHPLPWLKYADASDIEVENVDFDGMDVESPTGEHLGTVEAFILDSDTGRPYYIVVDSGGWFKSKRFLLPVGHARLGVDAEGEALVTALTRDRINKFPGFDKSEFEKLSEADLKRFNDETCAACTIEGVVVTYNPSEPLSDSWKRPDYRYPDWWTAEPVLPERMGEAAVTEGAEYRAQSNAEQSERPHERVTARSDDAGDIGRAQPGDVIGIETGGERTAIGDTAEDEDKRRRDAEETVAKNRNRS